MPKISVILPCLNEVSNIGNIITGIRKLGFTRTFCQIIIIDDGSTDGTQELLISMSKIDKSLVTIFTENKIGLAASIRTGIEHSKGQFIAVMDTDGMHDISYLPKMLDISENHNALVIGSRFVKGGSSYGSVYPKLSRLVNLIIQMIMKSKIRDQLCGFFVCPKSEIHKIDPKIFRGFGEYFISVIQYFEQSHTKIVELGTIHQVRNFGIRKSRRLVMLKTYFKYALDNRG